MFIRIADVYSSVNGFKTCASVAKFAIYHVCIAINGYRVGVFVLHHADLIAIPHRQTAKHACQVVQ